MDLDETNKTLLQFKFIHASNKGLPHVADFYTWLAEDFLVAANESCFLELPLEPVLLSEYDLRLGPFHSVLVVPGMLGDAGFRRFSSLGPDLVFL